MPGRRPVAHRGHPLIEVHALTDPRAAHRRRLRPPSGHRSAAVLALVLALIGQVAGWSAPAATRATEDPTAGALYVPIAPERHLDTREGTGLAGPFVAGKARTWTVAGVDGVPADATAVTGNLTVTNQTAAGYVSLGPVPTDTPTTSTLNFPKSDVRANGVTVPLGAGGSLSATYMAGVAGATTQLVFDVTGYFVAAGAGTIYIPINPERHLDTRAGTGLAGTFTSGTGRSWTIAGIGSVPANATAITGNLTVVGQTRAGYVSLGPVATDSPTTSTLNFPLGDIRANGVTVPLGAGGILAATYMASGSATTHLVFDVTGYFVAP